MCKNKKDKLACVYIYLIALIDSIYIYFLLIFIWALFWKKMLF